MSVFSHILSDRLGSILVSVILGLGLSAMFRKVCKNRDCIVLRAPHPRKIKGHVFSWRDQCYQFRKVPTSCKGKDPIKQQ